MGHSFTGQKTQPTNSIEVLKEKPGLAQDASQPYPYGNSGRQKAKAYQLLFYVNKSVFTFRSTSVIRLAEYGLT